MGWGQFVEVNVDLDMRRLSEGDRQLFNSTAEDIKFDFSEVEDEEDQKGKDKAKTKQRQNKGKTRAKQGQSKGKGRAKQRHHVLYSRLIGII